MKLQVTLLASLVTCSCSSLTSEASDPYRLIPRGREVKIDSTPTCEIVCAEVGDVFYFVARRPRGATTEEPWLTDLSYVRWADQNRNGVLDPGEPFGRGGRTGPATSYFMSQAREPLPGPNGPHLIEVDYVENGKARHLGPRRLP